MYTGRNTATVSDLVVHKQLDRSKDSIDQWYHMAPLGHAKTTKSCSKKSYRPHRYQHHPCATSTVNRRISSSTSSTRKASKSTHGAFREGREVTRTVLVGDLDVEEEEVEAVGVGADELGEHPVEGGAAADGGVRVPLERRLVHRHHHPRRRRRIRHLRTPWLCSLASSARRKTSFGEILRRGQKVSYAFLPSFILGRNHFRLFCYGHMRITVPKIP